MSAALRKAADRISETAIDDEIVVMSLDSGDFFSLTETACAIWKLLDTPQSREALIDAVAQDYQISPDAIAGDVDGFLAEMRKAGLIVQS